MDRPYSERIMRALSTGHLEQQIHKLQKFAAETTGVSMSDVVAADVAERIEKEENQE